MKTLSAHRHNIALVIATLSLALVFGALTTDAAKNDSPKKCPVCHNGNNPHTIMIKCSKREKYLNNHPGDYAGHCHNVSGEKPPKPKPSPKK